MPPRKKTTATDISPADADAKPVRAAIVPKSPLEWGALVKKVADEHWRKLRVTITMREWLLAGKPKSIDVAKAMLKARDLDEQIEVIPIEDTEARAKAAEQAVDEGLCEFHRREGKEGIWYPTNHIKAMLKENWSVLGLRVEIRGSRGAMAEGLFVSAAVPPNAPAAERDWIYLADGPSGVHTAVTHTNGPGGPKSALKRHEYVEGATLTFEVWIAHAINEKLPDEGLARTLVHASEHGTGACRSQGFGKFDIVEIYDIVAQRPSDEAAPVLKAG